MSALHRLDQTRQHACKRLCQWNPRCTLVLYTVYFLVILPDKNGDVNPNVLVVLLVYDSVPVGSLMVDPATSTHCLVTREFFTHHQALVLLDKLHRHDTGLEVLGIGHTARHSEDDSLLFTDTTTQRDSNTSDKRVT